MKKNNVFTMVVVSGLLLLLFVGVMGQRLLDFPKATHTEKGVPCSNLTMVKEILPNFSQNLFMAMPKSIAVNSNGWFYVYDSKLTKIFIFNTGYHYVGQFLEQGTRQGQVFPGGGGNKDIYAAPDNTLFIHDCNSDKILNFSQEGKFLKELTSNHINKIQMAFRPVVDKQGFFYTYSPELGIIDQLDRQLNPIHTYLDRNLNGQYIGYQPDAGQSQSGNPNNLLVHSKLGLMPSWVNTTHDITPEGMLFIFLHRSATVYLFKGQKLVRQFQVLIDSILSSYKEKLTQSLQNKNRINKTSFGFVELPMFQSCFIDYDEPYFYLQGNDKNNTTSLYQLDMSGKLIRILKYNQSHVLFKAKRNGLFYGLVTQDFHPIILKQGGKI